MADGPHDLTLISMILIGYLQVPPALLFVDNNYFSKIALSTIQRNYAILESEMDRF
jgi:hypothetical protein